MTAPENPSAQEDPVTLSPLQALALAAGIWAFGIAFGSYLRGEDMALACDYRGRYMLKGQPYACKALGVASERAGRP